MFKSNIISAGKMMAIVVMLFGVLYFASAFAPVQALGASVPGTFKAMPNYNFVSGALFFVLGLTLLVMFAKSGGTRSLGTLILITGTFIAVCGILSVVFVYRNPFSWMTVILGLAVFIDTLCLKLIERKV